MAHEDMTVDDVLALVSERRPVANQLVRTSDLELGFVMYDAFRVRGHYDDYGRGCWGFGIALGDGAWASHIFGQRLTIRSTRDQVRGALDNIDRYARLRLGAEYLEAYETAETMTDYTLNISDAIVVFLRNYPGKNEEEFRATFLDGAREAVREILDETSKIQMDWADKSLIDIGDEIERMMHERHPELSSAALKKLGNYVTYLVK